jgi:hypothetical protein
MDMTGIPAVALQDLFFLHAALDLATISFEEEAKSRKRKRKPTRHMACVAGAVACAVSFLEHSIDGLYAYAENTPNPTEFHSTLAGMWSRVKDQPILEKCQAVLDVAGQERFQKRVEPYESTRALIILRNTMAHPREVMSREGAQRKLEHALRRKYAFDLKRYGRGPFFPERCLTPDCAIWAVISAGQLLLEVNRRLPPTACMSPSVSGSVDAIVVKAEEVRRKHEGVTGKKRSRTARWRRQETGDEKRGG